MPRAKIILADDHSIVLEGLARLLSPKYEVVAAVQDGRELVKAYERARPDVVVTDISMPSLNGIEAALQIKKINRRTKIIFLTMHLDVSFARAAFAAGASAYVIKHSASSDLVTAIEEALQGRTFITPRIAGEVLEAIAGHAVGKELPVRITARQREVLQLVAEGHTIEEIAQILNVSPRTVQYHKYGMMKMLGFKRNAELIQYALKRGMGPG